MKPELIWDWPTRLFHVLLMAGLIGAFAIAKLGEHSGAFPYHSIIGLGLGAMLVLRIIWGLFGTRYARFTSFHYSPAAVVKYFKTILAGGNTRYPGHNPASSYAIFIMFALVAAIVGSGVMMSGGNESYKEIHEFSVYALLAVAGIHVAGVLLHTLRYRENISMGMITGMKLAEPMAAIRSSAPVAGVVFLLLMLLFVGSLVRNYDATNARTTIPLIGKAIELGEAEAERGSAPARRRDRDDD